MYKDKDLVFSNAQTIRGSSVISENVVNQGAAGDADEALWLVVRVATTFDSSGDASTLTVDLRTSAAEAMSGPVVLWSSPAIAQSALTANAILAKVRVPKGTLQYLATYYTESAAFTAGAIDAFLVKDVDALS